ncbi:hypothetical protein GCM10010390_50790 [Streptomyces mordarskii]|uniref:Uncharacterized protein n=1 Tax=Streptomyces mordarskii TaxID=1226758 RepID=A0ABN1DGX9_9ACTN
MVRWKWHRGHPADAEKRTHEYRAPRNQGPREVGAPGAAPRTGRLPAVAAAVATGLGAAVLRACARAAVRHAAARVAERGRTVGCGWADGGSYAPEMGRGAEWVCREGGSDGAPRHRRTGRFPRESGRRRLGGA